MKYAPRKVFIKENNVYVELSYKDFCRRRKADQSYMDKLFIRSFSPNREKCGKGITLTADEAAALLKALQKELNSGD